MDLISFECVSVDVDRMTISPTVDLRGGAKASTHFLEVEPTDKRTKVECLQEVGRFNSIWC